MCMESFGTMENMVANVVGVIEESVEVGLQSAIHRWVGSFGIVSSVVSHVTVGDLRSVPDGSVMV